MFRRCDGVVAVVVVLLVGLAGCAEGRAQPGPSGRIAPGLFGGHPPRGEVLPDDTLAMPHGRARGIVLLVHPGAWILTGAAYLQGEKPYVRWLNSLGWGTYDVDYRPGWLSVVDVIAAYDHLRATHPRAVICAYGQSAGGQLVMLLAASRPSLDCVISEAGIPDLATFPHRYALYGTMESVFHGRLWEFSPVRLARYIRQPLLCAGSDIDPVVPEAQQLAAIKRARPQTQVMLLAGAPTRGGLTLHHPGNFTHASVTAGALHRFRQAVSSLLRHSTQAATDQTP